MNEIKEELRHLIIESLNNQSARLSASAIDGLVEFQSAQFAKWVVEKYAEETKCFVLNAPVVKK